jgi:hypothetical protein
MTDEGPILDRLTHRLAECPPDFLSAPRAGGHDGIRVEAVVHDIIVGLGGASPASKALEVFGPPADTPPRALSLVLIACWLLHDGWFVAHGGRFAPPALAWLQSGLKGLSALVSPESFVRDPDRREELARLCLAALGLRPEGETEEQAEDRLRTLDSVERARLLRDTREQQERARRLREAMKKKEAEEAAAKVSRE